MVSVLDTFYYV